MARPASVSRPAVLAVGLTILFLILMPAHPIMEGDSPGYLQFAPIRTAGYPLFLELFSRFSTAAQVVLFGVAAGVLGEAVAKRTEWWVGLLVVIGMFAIPEPLHWTILTDSVTISLTALFLACCLTDRWLLAAVFAGLAATFRPSAYPLIVMFLFACNWRVMLQCLLIWLAFVGAERAYSYSVHSLASLAPKHLTAKALLIGDDPRYASVRQLLKESDGQPFRLALLNDYEVCLQWQCSPAPDEAAAIRTIRERPGAYLRLSWDEYRGLWSFASRTHPALAPRYDAFVRSHQMPFAAQIAPTGTLNRTVPKRFAFVARPAFMAVGVLMLLALLWAALRKDRQILIPALLAQALLVFTALTAVGYIRYTFQAWPAIVVVLPLLCFRLLRRDRAVASASKGAKDVLGLPEISGAARS